MSTPLDTEALQEQLENLIDPFISDGTGAIDADGFISSALTLITAQKEAWQREARIDELGHLGFDKMLPGDPILWCENDDSRVITRDDRINELKKEGK